MMLVVFGVVGGLVLLVGCIGGVMLGALARASARAEREDEADRIIASLERRQSGRRK